jgi:hypothetical protein
MGFAAIGVGFLSGLVFGFNPVAMPAIPAMQSSHYACLCAIGREVVRRERVGARRSVTADAA